MFIGLFLAVKLLSFTSSNTTAPIIAALIDAKATLFWPLFILRLAIYSSLIWLSPRVFRHFRHSEISRAECTKIRWSVVRILLVYELLFGLNIIQWI
ncbi:MAG TPA: hypothetical protein PKE57_01240 [Cellvibrionaceae bacterium]|nr:hypothetical protein [Cellvibrionaceae bacterium]